MNEHDYVEVKCLKHNSSIYKHQPIEPIFGRDDHINCRLN